MTLFIIVWARGSPTKAGQQQLGSAYALWMEFMECTLDGVMECSGQWQRGYSATPQLGALLSTKAPFSPENFWLLLP